MKKIFTIIFALCLSVLLSVPIFAFENNDSISSDSDFFVKEDIANDLSTRLNPNTDSFEFIFEETDVVFDFQHAAPVYRIANFNQSVKVNTLIEMLEFSGIYTLPVKNSSGMDIGIVELVEENEMWTISTFTKTDNTLASVLNGSSNILLNSKPAYLVEIIPLQEKGLLFSDGINEAFISLMQTNMRSTANVASIIDEIYDVSFVETYDDGYYVENNNISWQYVIIAIICFGLISVYIYLKKVAKNKN